MLEILKFIFSGFWVFIGFLFLFSVFCQSICSIFESLMSCKGTCSDSNKEENRQKINGDN